MSRLSSMRRVFAKGRWLLMLAFLAALWAGRCILAPPAFHAEVQTQIVTQDIAAMLGMSSEGTAQNSPAQQNVDHFNDLLNDDLPGGFLDTALQQANLKQPIRFNQHSDTGQTTDPDDDAAAPDPRLVALRKNLYVTALSKSMYAIGLTWDNKDECSAIVRAFQAQYITDVGTENAARSTATTSFLDSVIATDGKRLADTDKALIEYRTSHPDELPEAQSADISQLRSLKTQLDNMRISRQDAAMKRQALRQRLAQAEALGGGSVSTKRQRDPEYQVLQQKLVDANIAQQTQQAQMALIQQEIAHYNDMVTKIPAAQKTLTTITQDYAFVKAQYEKMLNLRAQAQLKRELDSVTASSLLQPIGAVHTHLVRPPWDHPILALSVLVLLLLLWAVPRVRRPPNAAAASAPIDPLPA